MSKAGDDAATLRCPPKVRDDLTGPDVLGVRLGMTHAEALATMRCALGEDAPVKTEARWFDRLDTNGIELGPQAFTVQQGRSEEHKSELQSLMRNSYAVYCLQKKTYKSDKT